jgi:hypothetical protein
MTTTSTNNLCDRIQAAVRDADELDILDALLAVFTFHMSLVECPHCRKAIACSLKQRVPEMLARANAAAAQRVSDAPHDHTCH